MQRWLVVAMTVLGFVGCYNTPRGGVTPYPPGPVDTLNILLRNDYSRLCPEHYDYCRAGKRSVCCPRGACCDDGVGPYCCDTRGYAAADDREWKAGERGPCGAHGTTCSRGGVTICCAENEGCCSDAQGLYCCSGNERSGY